MTDRIDPFTYGTTLGGLLLPEPEMPLDKGRPDRTRADALHDVADAWRAELESDGGVADADAWRCCLAGVWLLHGFLDEAHTICQDVPTHEGSYWHGVMHRREGDYGNAQYWFRRAGELPVGATIASAAAASPATVECALGGRWDPIRFVDVVRGATLSGRDREACQAVQRAEWRALFDWCWRTAVGR